MFPEHVTPVREANRGVFAGNRTLENVQQFGQPNDQWDYDWAFGRMLLKTSPNGKTLVTTGGKQAIFDAVEADTGKYAFSVDLGVQDVVVGIDPVTGAKKLNPKLTRGRRDDHHVPARGRRQELEAQFSWSLFHFLPQSLQFCQEHHDFFAVYGF